MKRLLETLEAFFWASLAVMLGFATWGVVMFLMIVATLLPVALAVFVITLVLRITGVL